MKDSVHIVLDLETMGNGPDAAIIAIGAAKVVGLEVDGLFYQKVDLASSMVWGGKITPSTVEWWLQQSDDARRDAVAPGVTLPLALDELHDFVLPGADLIWGNGSSFDNVILSSAYRATGCTVPWPFWADRDLRTILALYPQAKGIPFDGTQHNAKDDARHQAKQLIAALKLHYGE